MQALLLTALVAASAPLLTSAQSCASAYAQCGGTEDYKGPTCCVSGFACGYMNDMYSQCVPPEQAKTKPPETTKPPSSGSGSSTPTDPPAPTVTTGPSTYYTYDNVKVPAHEQAPYPTAKSTDCGDWKTVDNVCCPTYCSTNNQSESCVNCSGGKCINPPSSECKSGTMWGEQTTVSEDEKWTFSRSTHFGLTSGGACGFGLYGLCTKGSKTADWTDPMLGNTCDAFCKAYPVLCKDPSDRTLRGNFAAPNGDYYTQFWPHLVGERDNYLSCGECFELVRTKKDGTDYKVGETGYTEPIVLEIVDSCPCSANSKWCCGSGDDHCGEVSDFKYGCPIPKEAHHMDLSDIAMGRLQGNGSMVDGIIPIRYRRTPCPKPGNIYIWLRDGAGPWYFALSIVNAAGVGSVTKVELKGAKMKNWVAMVHDPNYTPARPQERYGSWVIPQGSGPFNAPVAMRITSPNGEQVVNEQAIKTFAAPANALVGFNYLDFGMQFTKLGKH